MSTIGNIFYKGYGYKELDERLSGKIKSIEDVIDNDFHFTRQQWVPAKLPKTYKIFNKFIPSYLNRGEINWYAFSKLRQWIKPRNKKRIFNLWAQHPKWNRGYWLAVETTDPELLKIAISKSIDYYDTSKYRGMTKLVAILFARTTEENINECAELLAKSTPAMMVCMLNSKNLSDKYIVLALKGLAKITTQQSIQQKVDLNLLLKLSPKSRLKAMKQLFGIVKHNRFISPTQPFNPEPTIDEVRKLLFSCMIQEYEIVAELIKRYEVILESCHKEVNS